MWDWQCRKLPVPKRANPSQPVSAAHQQAMEECKALYEGVQRGWLWQQRYARIESCFKEKTGMYPFQAHVNCTRNSDRAGPISADFLWEVWRGIRDQP
jgi:hypothetical protein